MIYAATAGNPGLTHARAAAAAVNASVAVPDFGDQPQDGESDLTSRNDSGADAVRRVIEGTAYRIFKPPAPEVSIARSVEVVGPEVLPDRFPGIATASAYLTRRFAFVASVGKIWDRRLRQLVTKETIFDMMGCRRCRSIMRSRRDHYLQ